MGCISCTVCVKNAVFTDYFILKIFIYAKLITAQYIWLIYIFTSKQIFDRVNFKHVIVFEVFRFVI